MVLNRVRLQAAAAIAIAVADILSVAGQAAPPQARTLFYGAASVTLEGNIQKKTFPGPPNYESVAKGDQPETDWILHLSRPVRVRHKAASASDTVEGVTDIQLVVGGASDYERYRPLLGQRVIATGTLFPAETGHHHTPVLLQMRTLRRAPKPAVHDKPSP